MSETRVVVLHRMCVESNIMPVVVRFFGWSINFFLLYYNVSPVFDDTDTYPASYKLIRRKPTNKYRFELRTLLCHVSTSDTIYDSDLKIVFCELRTRLRFNVYLCMWVHLLLVWLWSLLAW